MDDVIIIKKVVKDGKPPHFGTYRAITLSAPLLIPCCPMTLNPLVTVA